ncbi:hypothetical protein [Desulfoscipio gibsoniae]|uniref:hypothetical protein n=1 Tax=Desulfoscipio gibsoniae TaxID=102134 RepID=UPI000232B752|nr:hypothetical protein [Desulfoscipio gibsoniae]
MGVNQMRGPTGLKLPLNHNQQKGMELMEALIGLLKGDFPINQRHMRSMMTLSAWSEEKLFSYAPWILTNYLSVFIQPILPLPIHQ